MGLAFTHLPDDSDIWGKTTVQAYSIMFDASYPTGGEVVNASDIGGGDIRGVLFMDANAAAADYSFQYTPTSGILGKIQANDAAGEVANATDLSALTIKALFLTL